MTSGPAVADLPLDEARACVSADLVAVLRQVAERSSFFQERWTAAQRKAVLQAGPADVDELLQSLPLTRKDDLRLSQEQAPPFGLHLACRPGLVSRVHRTSGTTGRPLLIAMSRQDIEVTDMCGARAFRCAGLTPSDTVVHCLNYCMWAGGLTDNTGLEATGAAVVPFGTGNTEQLLDLQRWLPFTALSCTPSYVGLLLDRISDEQRERWRDNVRLILVGGEPGGSDERLRARVRDTLGAEMVNANYGLAEVLSNFGSECEVHSGMHFHGQDAIWLELLEQGSGRWLEPRAGAKGDLVLTHVTPRAQPLVRYQTNDTMEILATEPCDCGRETFRFRLHGRADDMFIVRGVNVFPDAVGNVLSEVSSELGEFAIVLPDATTFDRIPLYVESATPEPGVMSGRIEARVKERLGCGSLVTILEPGRLPRTAGKTQRLYRSGVLPPRSQSDD